MSSRKSISNTFTVTTMDDPVSVQAQYSPDKTVVHTVWQTGDLYMRTRESDSSAWSSWHKIVGESGGETDYQFALSANLVTQDGTSATAPSDISSSAWQDAPMATTTQKPYLWSKVQKKDGNGNNVGSATYIRLTGEEGVVYDIQTPVDSIHIGENQTSATLIGTAKFYKKEGTKDKVQTVFYYGVYKRTGTTFTKVATGNANSYAFSNLTVANTVNAVVIYLFASSYTGTDPESQTYLCKREMLVVDAGNSPYFADLDNEMDSIACTNDGKPSSEQTVETNVKLYRGSTALSPTLAVNDDSPSGAAYTSGTAKDGITVTWNNTTGNIKFKFGMSNSRTKAETFCITLTVTDNGATITRYLYFTVNCIRAALNGNPAALYRLVPSVNEIVKKKDGTYTPTGTTYITCGVTKNVGGTQSTPSASEYTLKYSLNGGSETDYTATSVKVNQVISNVVFILRVNNVVVDRETIGLIADGTDGTSPYFADLNNEMDAIQCKQDGSVIADQTVSTVISMWKGSAVEAFVIDNIYRNGTQLTWDGNNNGVWPRVSDSTVSLKFTASASIAAIDDFKITIHSYNDNTVTRELHFTINGVRANAIYRLVPSHSQIVKKKDGTYVPSGNVTCSVEKTENGSTSTPSSSEYTLEKSVNGGSYTTYSATAASSITSDLKFRLTVGGVVVDMETIPLVSDGNKGDTGDSAPAAFASPAQISIPCYSNGNVKAQKTTSVSFNLKVGAENATVTGITSGYTPTGVSVQVVYTNAATITVGTSATASGLSAGVTFTVTGTYDGKTYSATVTVALIGSTQGEQGDPGSQGDTGPRGKIGRFYYYAQEWSNDPSVSYAVTDAEAPFFFYKNPTTGAENYWVFNPAENDTYTMQDMGEPSSADENWIIMRTDFKFIITEAIFSNYAHLGSAIINGDYLISQYGYMLGFCNTRTPINDKTQYQNVDTDDILGEDNMYDSTKLIWDDSEVRTITSTEYTHISSASFIQNRYYAFEIDEETELSGNELLWTIVSQSGTVIANGTITSTATGMKRNCVIFKSTISTTCNLRVKIANKNEIVVISHLYLRFAKFIPYLAMDLLAGKIVANNIIARGELHADSLYHTMVYGNSNDDRFTINDESIVNLGTRAVGTTVILPSPTICKGRVIELFNHATSYSVTWVGALSTSTFSSSYGSGLGVRVLYPISYQYVKFYCDGTKWWILKAEA